ncbi:MAG: hypothetical protein RL771_626, partial [Actinomycetota bacterium]
MLDQYLYTSATIRVGQALQNPLLLNDQLKFLVVRINQMDRVQLQVFGENSRIDQPIFQITLRGFQDRQVVQ